MQRKAIAQMIGVQCGANSPRRGLRALPGRLRLLAVCIAAAASAAAALAQASPPEAPDRASAQVAVGATVLRHVALRVLTAPRTLRIAPADILSGYVDVPLASTLEIRSNSPGGCLLVIDSQADFSRGTEVRSTGGDGAGVALGRAGGLLRLQSSGPGMRTTPVALSFRVLLSPQARPGLHPWHLQLSVLPV